VTADGSLLFDGPQEGLYRTDAGLVEHARVADAIPASVFSSERFNHIGDVEFDPREGGRLLAPLECYYPYSAPPPDTGNPCGYGAVGVVDPVSLAWRYEVRLAGLPKAMWLALSPDGLLWTQAGQDLVAYRADDVDAGNATIEPVARLAGAAPQQYTGAAFVGSTLYVASDDFELWSVDLASGARTLQYTAHVRGESEGLAAFAGDGGTLHWIIAPGTVQRPTYGRTTSALLHLVPAGEVPPGTVQRLAPIRLAVERRKRTLRVRATAVVVGRRMTLPGVRIRAARTSVYTDGSGRAVLHAKRRVLLVASAPGFSGARVRR
jgi:hypothetical protein